MSEFRDYTAAAAILNIFGVASFDGMLLSETPMRVMQVLDDAIGRQQDAFKLALTQIGEHHSSEVQGWESEVRIIEGERDGLAEQLRMTTETQERLAARIDDLANRTGRAEAVAGEQIKLAQARSEEIDRLREDLHRVELDNARLEGTLERVRQFDPLSDRELADRDERPMVPANRYEAHGHSPSAMARDAFASTKASEPWYRRRSR